MNAIHRLLLGSLLVPVLVLGTGCPGNEEQPPVADDGSETEPADSGSDTGGSGSGTGDATVDDTGSDTDGEPCVEQPSDPIEILNGCTDATCEPFANTPERLPRLEADGSLPPLP